jgi:hypothetical protein
VPNPGHIAALHRGRVLNNEAVAKDIPELARVMIALRASAVTWFENLRRWGMNSAHAPIHCATMHFVLRKEHSLK